MPDDPPATGDDPIQRLAAGVAEFVACARALPDDVFLRRFGAWAPRDVVAHLIGWNRLTLQAIAQIRRGEAPAYLDDTPNDFANVNARSVRTYAATDRDALLAELERTAAELQTALAALAPEDWMRDFGAHDSIEGTVYIQRQVDPLAEDYRGHAGEIARWARGDR
jgi:hypothetical protein